VKNYAKREREVSERKKIKKNEEEKERKIII
jgi:hypothetical protein